MKQKRELVVLLVLVVVGAAIWWGYFRGQRPVTADAVPAAQNYLPIQVENPQIRSEEIAKARKTEYKSAGRNPFSPVLPPPLQPKKHEDAKPAPTDYGPKLPPPEPQKVVAPLPVKFYGFSTSRNGARTAFFTNGEDIYLVREGEVLLNRFRILKINNSNVEYEEISTGLRGTAPLEESAAPSGPSA
jgi:hypothetical protein